VQRVSIDKNLLKLLLCYVLKGNTSDFFAQDKEQPQIQVSGREQDFKSPDKEGKIFIPDTCPPDGQAPTGLSIYFFLKYISMGTP